MAAGGKWDYLPKVLGINGQNATGMDDWKSQTAVAKGSRSKRNFPFRLSRC